MYETVNENDECVNETKTRPKGRKYPKATNWSSTHQESSVPGGVIYL